MSGSTGTETHDSICRYEKIEPSHTVLEVCNSTKYFEYADAYVSEVSGTRLTIAVQYEPESVDQVENATELHNKESEVEIITENGERHIFPYYTRVEWISTT
jgi:hypothetical protein